MIAQRLSIFLITMILLGGSLHSQPHVVRHFSADDGMSNNYTTDIIQDRKGFIWIATGFGLNRFDGRKFKVYTTSNSGLPCNELNALLADPCDDKVWIATKWNGVCTFDYKDETISPFAEGKEYMIDKEEVKYLSAYKDKGIWIACLNLGLFYYDLQTKEITCYNQSNTPGLLDKWLCAVQDDNGRLFVGHQGGLSVMSIADRQVKTYHHEPGNPDSLPSNEVRTICIDDRKNVWLGTDKGVALMNPETERFTCFRHNDADDYSLVSDQVMDISKLSDDKIWISTLIGGVSILDLHDNAFVEPEKVRFENIRPSSGSPGLSGPNAICSFQDMFGNVWVGNYRRGIDFISYFPKAFNTVPYLTDRQIRTGEKQIWGMASTADGLWMAADGELLLYKADESLTPVSLGGVDFNIRTHINVIFKDSKGKLWLGTYDNGIITYEPTTGKAERIGGNETRSLDVCTFCEDRNGKIWIGTNFGIYTYNKGELVIEEELNWQLQDNGIHGIVCDRQGKIWVGTWRKGITIFDTDGRNRMNLSTGNGLRSMIIDSKGRIIVTTAEGIIIFPDTTQPEKFEVYSSEAGLENLQSRSIQEDQDGNLWISTNGGISMLDESSGRFRNYNHFDGVPSGDFMDNSAAMAPDGTLVFGSQSGACYFNPRYVLRVRNPHPIQVTEFNVHNSPSINKFEEISLPLSSGDIVLPYDQNTFSISFNVMDLTQSEQLEYAYTLEGMDNNWYNTMGENKITFRNVPPGKYMFKVKSRFRYQDWDDDVCSLFVRVNPPWWLTWYAKMTYFVLVVLVVYAWAKFYKHKLELESSLELERRHNISEQYLNEERLRFFTNITHELRNPLTLIMGPLEDLLSDNSLSPKHSNKISVIHDSATRLLNLINRILEFRKTETQNRKLTISRGNLAHALEGVLLRYKELNINKDVEYVLSIETDEKELFYDEEAVTIMVDNLLSNATKYTKRGSITLALRSVEESGLKYSEISVSDTGVGIPYDAQEHIFERYYQAKSKYQASGTGIGLALVKNLCDLHEAELKVESVPEQGTTFRIRLLTENSYPDAAHARPEEKAAAVENEESETTVQDTGQIVLVVEDNADIREYIRGSLSDFFEVITAKDGKEAWELAQSRIPNVIVSDVMMPEMDGIELCRLVKDDIRTSHIPVILLTAKDSMRDKQEGYVSGADSYLTKPFSSKLLHSRINNLLENRRRIASLITAKEDMEQKHEEVKSQLSPRDQEFLEKLKNVIYANLDMEKMDVAFIADKMCMSHSTLYRKIKGLTDMSANEFIRKAKMYRSVELLVSGQYTISEISVMVGFSSVAYFRQCFKEEYGVSPSEYVKSKN